MAENSKGLLNNVTVIQAVVNISDSTDLKNENCGSVVILKWITSIYFCVLVVGVCINLSLIISLLRQKRNGTLYLILQFSSIDVISSGVAASEIWTLYADSWNFSENFCQLFLGTEVFTNTITCYFHILLNLHALSAWNMQSNTEMSSTNPLTSNIDDSNECLMTRSDNSIPNRILNIDYRRKQTFASIILPSMLIWFTCLSLTIPEYTLSTTVEYHNTNQTLCTIVDLHYRQLLQVLLILFREIVPIPLLFITITIVAFKFFSSNSMSNNISAKKILGLKKLLFLCLVLSTLYIITSLQRSLFHILHFISQHFNITVMDNFKIPPLNNLVLPQTVNIYLSMFHYSAILFRPMCCIISIPSTFIAYKQFFFKVNS